MMIAFCTTCKGRVEHLERTLPKNLGDNVQSRNLKFIVLAYGDNEPRRYLGHPDFGNLIDGGRLVLYEFPEGETFRMAHAKNMAHRCGMLEGADILVNVDADNFTGPGFASYVANQFQKHKYSFLWSRMIRSGPDRLPRGISGRIAVTKDAFLKAGGYDEQFQAWSPDDKDFNLRLRRLGYQGIEIENQYLNAILHNDKMRFREWGKDACTQQEDSFAAVVDSETTVVNAGRVGCGTVYRNFDPNPIALEPVPTRIFGIGMHKTATTSLHHALHILGYESAHWMSAHWAKAIWEEMQAWGRSPTLERHYAITDLPMPLLYKELDKAYPGSKFILTIRDEEKWIESVENHWDRTKNQFRDSWDTDPFSHRVHKLLYGQKQFNREVMLERYRRHNREVIEYFAGRPFDLLVTEEQGWGKLCRFLKQPIPTVPYPLKNGTASVSVESNPVSLCCAGPVTGPARKDQMSLLKTIETIGQDILKGVDIAGPIIETFEPQLAPIINEIEGVIAALEGKNASVTKEQMSQMVQALSMANAIKQAAAAKAEKPA
jgi:hypothetical protein